MTVNLDKGIPIILTPAEREQADRYTWWNNYVATLCEGFAEHEAANKMDAEHLRQMAETIRGGLF